MVKDGRGFTGHSHEHRLNRLGIPYKEKSLPRADFSNADSQLLERITKDPTASPGARKSAREELVKRERKEHPWLTRPEAEKVVSDHIGGAKPILDLGAIFSLPLEGAAEARMNVVIKGLDPFEQRSFATQMDNTKGNKEKSLEILINNVEGDPSQMSPELRRFAEEKGWLKQWEEIHKGGTIF